MEDSERDSIILSISEKENTLSDLKEEMEALKNFNHTRYVSAREYNRKANELHTKLEQIEEQLNSLSDQLIEAAQNGNYDLIESLNEQALDLKKHKADLLQPDQESETLREKHKPKRELIARLFFGAMQKILSLFQHF